MTPGCSQIGNASFVFRLNKEFNRFSLGDWVGRALNRSVALTGGYTRHIVGRKSFNHVFIFQLEFVFAPRRDASGSSDADFRLGV